MTGPYSSALLNAPAPAEAPRTVVVPSYASMPVQQYAPQPQYVQAAPSSARRGSRIESTLLGLVVLIVIAVMAVAGYAMARGTAPSQREYAAAQNIAQYNGFQDGRTTGIQAGRSEAAVEGQRIAQLKGLIARQQQYNKGYAQGRKIGEGQYSRPRSTGSCCYRGGYRTPTYRSSGSSSTSAVSSAIQAAQQYANATGSDVDVEVE